ncbi:tetratricopeptide repeat protein [Candidatus Nitrotoga arctica]|uniref:Tetratricopeptide repeat-containing protein n=1 Tax=Candidatus Nitrotoga arctica TaxID=453162 RepID=A0ABM8YZ23_9PROT|nr:tetratricopeptide repeat protein [Candidatus Nitrotoga arctica]CAG9932779.1 Tetratricopeptide repeat-containing protein [Candidatus Nitrotoga arctica]
MKQIKLRIAFSLTILVVLGLLAVNQVSAVAPYKATAAELSVLPLFCQTKLSATSSAADHALYSGKIGPDWLHIHHYCFGLNFINRYKRSFGNKTDQAFYFQSAMSEFEYIFGHSSPTFWLRPEMHVQKGKLLAAAKRNVEAVSEFEQALQRDPNYVEAYVALSELYQNTGQQLKSIAAVEQALQRAPNSKPLQRRYNQLTGKIFTPPTLTVEQVAQISPMPVTQAVVISGVSSTTVQPVPASSPVVVPEKIGTPTNPYCRFCPSE